MLYIVSGRDMARGQLCRTFQVNLVDPFFIFLKKVYLFDRESIIRQSSR